jgi:tetratricopeptide (TPR) repeat protein/tRNA A-37 threonylcarbamoyl transferase component Bud32
MHPSTVYCDHCGAANRPTARFCTACGHAMPAASALPPTVLAGGAASPSTPPSVQAVPPPPSPSLTGLLPANSLLKGQYLILSKVGQGGMGAVYKAADTRLGDRLVALKEMSQKGLDPHELVEAADGFRREAVMLASLPHHSHLPSIYDHFEDGGRWYLVMDFIAGETLEDYLATAGGKLPVAEVLDLGIQLATVLAYLHRHQPPIIFRDLKPANIMRTAEGDLFLIDFGIARHFKAGQAKDTIAYGSAGYAAPEQYGKTQTTPQSDIYSLGATLHHLLTGLDPSQSPFRFAPLSGAGIPTGLGTLIAQMLDMDASSRPASMAEVKQELQRLQRLAAQPTASQLAPTQYVGGSSLPPTQLAVPVSPPPVSPAISVQFVPPVKPSVKPISSTPPAHTGASPTLQKTKEQWISEGAAHYGAKRYQEALAAYEQAIRLNPNDAAYHNRKGTALLALKRHQEALAAYEEAIRLNPTNDDYHDNRGIALSYLQRYQEALAAYEQAIRLNPNYALAYRHKGDVLDDLKRYREALAAYEQAIRLNPNDAQIYYYKGITLLNLKRNQEALAACEQAIRLDSNFALAYYNKGVVLYRLKRYQEGLAVLEQAIRLDPNRASFYCEKANALYELKRYQEGLAAYEQAIRLDSNFALAYYNMSLLLEELGEKRAAQQAREKAKQLEKAQ